MPVVGPSTSPSVVQKQIMVPLLYTDFHQKVDLQIGKVIYIYSSGLRSPRFQSYIALIAKDGLNLLLPSTHLVGHLSATKAGCIGSFSQP